MCRRNIDFLKPRFLSLTIATGRHCSCCRLSSAPDVNTYTASTWLPIATRIDVYTIDADRRGRIEQPARRIHIVMQNQKITNCTHQRKEEKKEIHEQETKKEEDVGKQSICRSMGKEETCNADDQRGGRGSMHVTSEPPGLRPGINVTLLIICLLRCGRL